MFYEDYHNGKGWGVRRITDEKGHACEDVHIEYFGTGTHNHVKAVIKAKELNKKDFYENKPK